jgi:hypothetical protein
MTFCYGNVYVMLEPWSIEAATHPSVSVDLLRGLEQRLQIKDIGYAMENGTHLSNSLHSLGPTPTDLPLTQEWLREHEFVDELCGTGVDCTEPRDIFFPLPS